MTYSSLNRLQSKKVSIFCQNDARPYIYIIKNAMKLFNDFAWFVSCESPIYHQF